MKLSTEKLHEAARWVTEALVLKRWQAVVIAGLIGLSLSAVVYVWKQDAEHARERRAELAAQDKKLMATDRQLADAIRRLARLENPTVRERRKQIERLLEVITPEQASNLGDILNAPPAPGSTTPPQNTSPRQGSRGPRGGRGPNGRPGPDGNGPRPPVDLPPTPNPPRPPTPSPPQFDLPPFDLDGPGPLPPVDLPRIPPVLRGLIF